MTSILECGESSLEDDGLFAPGVPGEHEAETPEKALLAAVLRQALLEAAGIVGCDVDGVNRRRVIAQAQAWLRSRRVAVMTFEWVCQVLRLDPDYVREHRRKVVGTTHLVHVRHKRPKAA